MAANANMYGTGPFGSNNALSGIGYITTSQSEEREWPDIQITMSGLGVSKALDETVFEKLFNLRHDILKNYMRDYDGHDANYVLIVLVR